MPEPSISVLMAVYNGEKHLNATIESILDQTFRDFEFVIVDDGSTDGTLDIINSYNDKRIILHKNKENIGQIGSLNNGLSLAKGEFVARIDAGDISFPERLEKQYEFAVKHPEYAVVGSAGMMVDESYERIGLAFRPTTYFGVLERMFFSSPLIHVSAFMKRKIVLSINGYDENFPLCADYDLWLRMIGNNFKIVNLNDVLVKYIVCENSLGAKEKFTKNVKENSTLIIKAMNRILPDFHAAIEEIEKFNRYFLLGPHWLTKEERLIVENFAEELFCALTRKYCLNFSTSRLLSMVSKCYLKSALALLAKEDKNNAKEFLWNSLSKNRINLEAFLLLLIMLFGDSAIKLALKQMKNFRKLHDLMTAASR